MIQTLIKVPASHVSGPGFSSQLRLELPLNVDPWGSSDSNAWVPATLVENLNWVPAPSFSLERATSNQQMRALFQSLLSPCVCVSVSSFFCNYAFQTKINLEKEIMFYLIIFMENVSYIRWKISKLFNMVCMILVKFMYATYIHTQLVL